MTRNKTSTEPQLRIGDHCHTKKWITDWCGQPNDRRTQLDWAVLIEIERFGWPPFKALLGACGADGSHCHVSQGSLFRMLRLSQMRHPRSCRSPKDTEAAVGEAKVTDAPFRLSKPNGVARFGPLSVKRVCLLTALGSSSGACRNPAPSPSALAEDS